MGELHLDILVDRMRREFKVEANVGKPQVAYRETIRKKVEKVEYTHKKQTGGSGQFANVLINLEPHRRRRRDLRVREQGHRRPHPAGVHPVGGCRLPGRAEFGVLAGYPLVDVKVTPARRRLPRGRLLRDGVQDRRLDGVEEGCRASPAGHPGTDHGRRGHHARGLHGRCDRRPELPPWPDPGHGGASGVARRQGPCAAVGDVRLRRRPAVETQGRANYSMQFDSYAEVPANVAKEIIAKARGE